MQQATIEAKNQQNLNLNDVNGIEGIEKSPNRN